MPNVAFAQGSYVGDGGTGKFISLPFQPKVVCVKADHATNGQAMMRTDTMTTAKNVTNSTEDQGISALFATGFTVDHIASAVGRTNEAGKTYYWWAFGGPLVKTGSFTNGSQTISGLDIAPVFVAVLALGNSGTHIRTTDMTTESYDLGVSSGNTDGITGLTSDGFTVGAHGDFTGANHYWSLGAADNLHVGTYQGNNADNRDLPSAPMAFDPDFALIKGNLGQEATHKITSLGGDAALQFGTTAQVSNRIQSLTPTLGKFQIGSDSEVNFSTPPPIDYYFIAAEVDDGTSGGGGPPGEEPPVSDSPTGGIIESSQASNYIGLCGGIGVFARQPIPPFTVLAGPFYPRSARRLFAMSEVETGDIELAIADISDPAWLLPGACWSIESGCEELWVGFIRPGEVELDSDSARLSLEGPTALLDLEVGSSDRMHYDAGSAMIDFLLSAQARSTIGVFPGNILRGIAVDTSARGQTLSNFIQSASEEAGIDWHIRAERDGYNGVAFYLDAGDLRRETTTKIVKDDLVAGILRQRPITGSITAFGAAATFEGRNVATVNALATGLLGGNRLSYPPDQSIQNLLQARNIGPAASRHRSLFFERTSRGLEVLVTKRMVQEAFAIDELIVVLDQNDFRDVRIADMISLEVMDWIPGLTVEGRFQVRRSEPNEELEDKDMVLWALP